MKEQTRSLITTRQCAVLLTAWLTVGVVPAQSAGEHLPTEDEFYKEQFAGWGGIVFRCLFDEQKGWERRICERVATDARFLAATSSVPFKAVAEQNYYYAARAASFDIEDALILEANIVSTAATGSTAVHLRLQAGNHYSKAIDQESSSGPESVGRSGTLVLWSKDAVASGDVGTQLELAVASTLKTMLKDFFGVFVPHWEGSTAQEER